ncbi:hypothetical protein WDW89_09620 [Deltaproteobacteria bacterium TL4]
MLKNNVGQDIEKMFSQLDVEAQANSGLHSNLEIIINWFYKVLSKAVAIDGVIDDEERKIIEETLQPFSLKHGDAFRRFLKGLYSPDIFVEELSILSALSLELRQSIFKIMLKFVVIEEELSFIEEDYINEIGPLLGLDPDYIQSEVDVALERRLNQ